MENLYTRYLVYQRYYDSGRVEAWLEVAHAPVFDLVAEEHPKYDYYVDVFESENDAREYLKECRNT